MKKISGQTLFRIPGRLYLAAGGMFIAAVSGWMRFILSLYNWSLYQTLGVQPGVWYLVINGLLSGLVYTVAGMLTLIPHEKWKRPVSVLLISGLMIFWIDRIYFAHSLEAQKALPFSLIFSAGLTLLAFCFLFWNTVRSQLRKWKE